MPSAVADIRAFNRFYTARVGLLRKRFLESDLSLPEVRVLFELARGHAETAADLVRELGMDKGHVSRILDRFRTRGWVTGRPSPTHGKRILLALTEKGRAAFAEVDARQETETGALVEGLDPAARARLAGSMRTIESLLRTPAPNAGPAFTLRDPKPGELGWTIARQAAIYHEEQGWGVQLEAICARVLADFVDHFDPARDQAWIADRDGEPVGSIFLAHTDDPKVGKLRLLCVEPSARGLGVGSALVEACVAKARAAGYERLELWTHAVLAGARRIYQRAGFELVSEAPHSLFGTETLGQTWALKL